METKPRTQQHRQVIVFPRGQLSPKDKERLSKIGIVAVEADDPSKVVTVIPGTPLIDGDTMLAAALKTIAAWAEADTYKRSVSSDFVISLARGLK